MPLSTITKGSADFYSIGLCHFYSLRLDAAEFGF